MAHSHDTNEVERRIVPIERQVASVTDTNNEFPQMASRSATYAGMC